MKSLTLKRYLPVLTIAAVLGGGAMSVAQTQRRPTPRPRVPQRQLQATPYSETSTADSRAIRDLVEDLENSTAEEVRSGQISRYFVDPAVIITNGRMHRIDWARVRDDRLDDRQDPRDRGDNRARDADPDRDDRFDPAPSGARLEAFQIRRIDPRTVVVMYTAVLPDRGGVFRQPVVATLIRESGRAWRIASYTAENAAIPGTAAQGEID
jgi:hypothetical protein